jgi:nitrate/TMAO reductase-like tetraheme cytochrome c subunit
MNSTLRTALVSVVGGAVVALVVAGGIMATDQPRFCNSCHEMGPFYGAWQHGPHKDLACVECHVDPGVVAHATHKIVALKEVFVHAVGDPEFPLASKRAIPDSRCTRCHTSLPDRTKNAFEHASHRSKSCADCHTEVGHSVTVASLAAAGVYAGGGSPGIVAQTVAFVGAGTTLKQHPRVTCSGCHKMSEVECGTCHKLPAGHFRPSTMPSCTLCHRSGGASWAASHPVAAADCALCHDAPTGAKHPTGIQCVNCHPQVGTSFAFRHPQIDTEGEHDLARIPCVQCHPKDYSSYDCKLCHASGTSGSSVRAATALVSPPGAPTAGPQNGIHVETNGKDDVTGAARLP